MLFYGGTFLHYKKFCSIEKFNENIQINYVIYPPPPLKFFGYCLTVPSLLCQPCLPSPPTRTSCYMYVCTLYNLTSECILRFHSISSTFPSKICQLVNFYKISDALFRIHQLYHPKVYFQHTNEKYEQST